MLIEGEFVTIVGTKHYNGQEVLKVGQIVRLVKEPDNAYDAEAIAAKLDFAGKVGYVANSPHTVARGTKSAGRIYDTFDEERYAVICFILKGDAIAKLIDYHEYSIQKGNVLMTTSFFTTP